MANSVHNSNQRLKILYLYKILTENTDENHPMSMPEIVAQLEKYNISAERKAVYNDIEALSTFGLDIIIKKGRYSGYFVGSRDFELPELKLLADAVSSSRFLTVKKSSQLISKIAKLASVYDAKQLERQVYVANRVKSMNETIYFNVDKINRAIDEGKQINFKYFDYDVKKKKHYRGGRKVCSPYALAWDDERYYLIAFYEKYGEISNFRVDRMESVEILNAPIKPKPEDFDVAEYLNSTFSMFSGKKQLVKLRFANNLVNPVLDRFGKDVALVPEDKDHFSVRVNIKPTTTFFGWLFEFGENAEIVEPLDVKNQYIEQLRNTLAVMQDNN